MPIFHKFRCLKVQLTKFFLLLQVKTCCYWSFLPDELHSGMYLEPNPSVWSRGRGMLAVIDPIWVSGMQSYKHNARHTFSLLTMPMSRTEKDLHCSCCCPRSAGRERRAYSFQCFHALGQGSAVLSRVLTCSLRCSALLCNRPSRTGTCKKLPFCSLWQTAFEMKKAPKKKNTLHLNSKVYIGTYTKDRRSLTLGLPKPIASPQHWDSLVAVNPSFRVTVTIHWACTNCPEVLRRLSALKRGSFYWLNIPLIKQRYDFN